MALRGMLHQGKIAEFVDFLVFNKGYIEVPVKGKYEYARLVNGTLSGPSRTVVVYQKTKGGAEHLTVQDKDFKLLREFLHENK